MIKRDRDNLLLGFSKRAVISSVTLLIYLLLFASCDSDNATVDELSGSGREQISTFDFENFCNGGPEGMEVSLGASTGETDICNLIMQDTVTFVSGRSSVSITGSSETTNWQRISTDIPNEVSCVTARFYAKGEDLGQELNQYNNCYAGFLYDDVFGGTATELIRFPMGTSDWMEFTVSLDIEANFAENVQFVIFSSISGTLWLDDLSLIYDDDSFVEEESELPEPLADYITDLTCPTTFMDLAPQTDSECAYYVTKEEALEDIEMLRYLFENAYSGYEYWENQGVDFSAICDRLIDLTNGSETVSVVTMESILAEGLEDVQDGHLAVSGHQIHRFLNRKNPYFTDVIVEREMLENGDMDSLGEYRVVQSGSDLVQPGMIYTGSEERLFRILSRNGVEQFQLGVFSSGYEYEAAFQFQSYFSDFEPGGYDGSESLSSASVPINSIVLPLHECRLNRTPQANEQVYSSTKVDGIDLIRVSSFGTQHNEELLEFAESGADLSETACFIVDLMGNSGGSSVYGGDFIAGLNGIAQWRMYHAVLCSPATLGSYTSISINGSTSPEIEESASRMQHFLELMRERPVRTWLHVSHELPDRQMGEYEGSAVFLVDRGVASSGEALLDYSKSVPGAVVVGENTAGIGTFGEVRHYWLPNSNISLLLPCKLFLAPDFEEGVGYLPDYWLDSPEPVSEITAWLNNPDTYQFELPPKEVLHDLSFDEFPQGVPMYMNVRVGATSGYGQRVSTVSRDCEIKTEGSSSLRIDGDVDTDLWNSLYLDVPQDIEVLDVTYDVRGENIHREGNQFDNCYVGFIYMDPEGNRQFTLNSYEDSFDWKQDSLQLNLSEQCASGVQFIIFMSKSGTLWIDDVVFSER